MGNDTMTIPHWRLARLVLALVSLLAMGFATLPSAAQELAPEHLGLARKYIDLTDKSAIFEVTLVETGIETMRTILSQNPELTAAVDTAVGKTLETYKGRKGELLDQFARVYALRFSMEELQQIVTFYESPVGAKLASANATINQDLQAVMQVFENNTKSEFYAKVKAELKAAGIEI